MSVLILKLIACLSMLIDHIGYQYGILAFRFVGRIAFPIFVYLISNGYRHTSNKTRYALRLAIFAILSQVPFSLFCYGVLWQNHGNVMFTLLLALLCIWSAEELRASRALRWFAFVPSLMVCALYHFGYMSSDYGATGILMVLVFYYFDGKSFCRRVAVVLGMFIAVFYDTLLLLIKSSVHFALGRGFQEVTISQWELIQAFSLLSLIFIFCYNGKKGNGSTKLLQYSFYAFYPLHQLVLWFIHIL